MVSSNGWIGVDLDGTLFKYERWVGWNVFGEPVQPMLDRVKAWLAEGKDVRIVTARIGLPKWWKTNGKQVCNYSGEKHYSCRVTGEMFSDHQMMHAIQDHLERYGLPRLTVQCWKDVGMIELWDDRCVQVVPNTGRTVAEEAEARYNTDGKYSDFRGGDE